MVAESLQKLGICIGEGKGRVPGVAFGAGMGADVWDT